MSGKIVSQHTMWHSKAIPMEMRIEYSILLAFLVHEWDSARWHKVKDFSLIMIVFIVNFQWNYYKIEIVKIDSDTIFKHKVNNFLLTAGPKFQICLFDIYFNIW